MKKHDIVFYTGFIISIAASAIRIFGSKEPGKLNMIISIFGLILLIAGIILRAIHNKSANNIKE